MTNEEFLSYVESHSKTERALFSWEHVERLHSLMGGATLEVSPGDITNFYVLRWDEGGEEAVKAARGFLKAQREFAESVAATK